MHALRVLEFPKILELLAGQCQSPRAVELAHELQPQFEEESVWFELGLTDEAAQLLASDALPSLNTIRPLQGPLEIAKKKGVLDGASLFAIATAMATMRQVRTLIRPKQASLPGLWRIAEHFPELPQLEAKVLASVDADGEVLDGASPELRRLRRARQTAASRIVERIQSYTVKHRDWLSDNVYTVRDGRYVIPLRAEHKGKVRGIVHDTSSTGQTVFIEPEDVLQLGNQLREAEAEERVEIQRILRSLSDQIGNEADQIAPALDAAAELDLILAKARLGHQMDAVIPIRSQGHRLFVRSARHPMLDAKIAVPLTLDVGGEFDGVLITGPNTGGKTVAIKTVGLCTLMAQAGMMVPAAEARLGVFTQIWADIGDEQSLQQSLSTFSGHIKNISEALRGIRPGALVLFDEVGAGTDPAEGAALAIAILQELQSRGGKILASTHYGELKVFAYSAPGFTNASMEFDLKTLRPTYKLQMGAPGASHALRIAERCGMPKEVVERAKGQFGAQEQDLAQMLEKLEEAQKRAQRAQSEADRLSHRLRQVEDEAERKLAEATELRRTAKAKAAEELDDALRTIRLEAADIFEQLKSDRSDRGMEQARERLKNLQSEGQARAGKLRPDEAKKEPEKPFAAGDAVKIRGYAQVGTLINDPRDNQAMVQIGPLKMTVKLSQIEPVAVAKPTAAPAKPRKNMGLQKAMSGTSELDLRHMRAEEAEEILMKFVDDSLLAGFDTVRIVHGKGEGILRSLTQGYLKRHRGVKSFRDGEPGEGGHGVTIATLK